jgi:hypothetical protein
MTQWEYKLCDVPASSFMSAKDAERWYNERGREGWECVSISPSGNKAMFKRPLVVARAN